MLARSAAPAAATLRTAPTAGTIIPILSKRMPKPVTIYTTDYCPYCTRAKALFQRKSVPFKEINVTHDEKMREELEAKTGWMTVPMVFIGEEFIGGADELYALENAGKLDQKLA